MAHLIRGVIMYKRNEAQLIDKDYGVTRLLKAARKKGISMQILTPSQFELVVTQADEHSVFVDDQPFPLPDFVIPRLGANLSFYALSIIRHLQNLGSYVCNNAQAISSVKDKLYMHQCLASSRLSTPKTMLAKFPVSSSVVKQTIGFPLVIKNVTGTQGAGIYLCESEDKFMDVMELIYTNNDKANIILQEFVKDSFGRDLRVFVIGGRVVGCMQRSSDKSFKANYSKGGAVQPFELTPEVAWLATETAKLFDLDVAGVDLLFDGDSFKVCEANSSPGFQGLEQVVGPCIAESIIDYILIKTGLNTEVNACVDSSPTSATHPS